MKIAALLMLAALTACATPIVAIRQQPFTPAKTAQRICVAQATRNTPGMQLGLVGGLASEHAYLASYDGCMYDQGWRGGD